jgi:hypothetical protein
MSEHGGGSRRIDRHPTSRPVAFAHASRAMALGRSNLRLLKMSDHKRVKHQVSIALQT